MNKRLAHNSHYQNGSGAGVQGKPDERRMVCKCVNGVVLATPILAEMYPDATFFRSGAPWVGPV
jgi:hypothetical protein